MPTLSEPFVASRRFTPSDECLQLALSAAQAGIWQWDLHTNDNYWSDEIWPLYGLSRQTSPASFESWLFSVHPQDRKLASEQVATASQRGKCFEIEWRTNPANGPVRWILSRGQPCRPLHNGNPSYIGIVMDITARKEAEQSVRRLNDTLAQRVTERTAALSEHERLLRHILDGVPGLVGYWTHELINRFANKSYSQWFGKTPEEIRGSHIRDLLGQQLFEQNLPHLQAALAGVPQRFERMLPIPGHPGEYRHSEVHYLPDSSQGEVKGILVMVFDISQIKRAELAAEAANQAKSEFLANISHEVRTPLNAMFGLAQVGARHASGTPTARTFEQILDSARHLLTLVNDVLDFSKIEAGKLSLHDDRVDLAQVLDQLTTLKSVRAHAKGLKLVLDEATRLPRFFRGDSTRLYQILLNLVSNAIKFTEQGEVRIRLAYNTPCLSIAVSDTGIGISPNEARRMFQPFEQFNPQACRQEGGTGLGLAITRRLVDMMQGHIEVQTQPGLGSTFTVTLPLNQPEPADFNELPPLHLLGLPANEAHALLAGLHAQGCAAQISVQVPGVCNQARAAFLISDRIMCAELLAQLRPHLHAGHRLLIAAGANAVLDLPRDILAQAHVITGPLSPLRLLHALLADPRQASPAHTQRLQGIRVLAAEDNPLNRLVLGEMLEQEGARLVFAHDGEHALAQLRQHGAQQFDVMLCDIQMPVLDGYQTAQAMRHMAPQLPIIGLTAHAFDSAKQQAREAGMVGYVTKPYLLDTLVDEIRRCARKPPDQVGMPAPLPATPTAAQPAPMTAAPPPSQDITDWQAMQQHFRDQPQLLDRLVGLLQDTLTGIDLELARALDTHDLDALAKIAHNLKGTALNLHTPELARLAIQTQDQARQGAEQAWVSGHQLAHRLRDFIALAARHHNRRAAALSRVSKPDQ